MVAKFIKKTCIARINSKPSWAVVNGIRSYYRSKMELRYARYLENLVKIKAIKDFKHEPQTFWFTEIKRGVRSYLPDFKVINTDNSHYWVEVKGYMDAKSLTKIKRFKKYYPQEKIIVVKA